VELSLRCLFDEPTPRGMSIEIERLIHARLAAMSEDEAQRLRRRTKRLAFTICLTLKSWPIRILSTTGCVTKIRCIGIHSCTPGW
jgi:hypothetical protein